jgi:hypothetical protein
LQFLFRIKSKTQCLNKKADMLPMRQYVSTIPNRKQRGKTQEGGGGRERVTPRQLCSFILFGHI